MRDYLRVQEDCVSLDMRQWRRRKRHPADFQSADNEEDMLDRIAFDLVLTSSLLS